MPMNKSLFVIFCSFLILHSYAEPELSFLNKLIEEIKRARIEYQDQDKLDRYETQVYLTYYYHAQFFSQSKDQFSALLHKLNKEIH